MNQGELNAALLEAIFEAIEAEVGCECDECCEGVEIPTILVDGEEVEWTMDTAVAVMEAAMEELDNLFELGMQDTDAAVELEGLACFCSDMIDSFLEGQEEVIEDVEKSSWEVTVDFVDSHHVIYADKFREYGGFIHFINEVDGNVDLVAMFKQERIVSIKSLS